MRICISKFVFYPLVSVEMIGIENIFNRAEVYNKEYKENRYKVFVSRTSFSNASIVEHFFLFRYILMACG